MCIVLGFSWEKEGAAAGEACVSRAPPRWRSRSQLGVPWPSLINTTVAVRNLLEARPLRFISTLALTKWMLRVRAQGAFLGSQYCRVWSPTQVWESSRNDRHVPYPPLQPLALEPRPSFSEQIFPGCLKFPVAGTSSVSARGSRVYTNSLKLARPLMAPVPIFPSWVLTFCIPGQLNGRFAAKKAKHGLYSSPCVKSQLILFRLY